MEGVRKTIKIKKEQKGSWRKACLRNQSLGQGFVEYALIFSFVILILIVVVAIFGQQLNDTYQNILDNIRTASHQSGDIIRVLALQGQRFL